jgi:hypothetical protein
MEFAAAAAKCELKQVCTENIEKDGTLAKGASQFTKATLATEQQGFYNPHHHAVMDKCSRTS